MLELKKRKTKFNRRDRCGRLAIAQPADIHIYTQISISLGPEIVCYVVLNSVSKIHIRRDKAY